MSTTIENIRELVV